MRIHSNRHGHVHRDCRPRYEQEPLRLQHVNLDALRGPEVPSGRRDPDGSLLDLEITAGEKMFGEAH